MSDQNNPQLTFVRAADDPPVSDPEFQQGLREVSTALRDGGVAYSQRRMIFDVAGAEGYALGEYFLPLPRLLAQSSAGLL